MPNITKYHSRWQNFTFKIDGQRILEESYELISKEICHR